MVTCEPSTRSGSARVPYFRTKNWGCVKVIRQQVLAMSALPPKADIAERGGHVRFVPKAGIVAVHCTMSSAATSIVWEIVRPRVFGCFAVDDELKLCRLFNRQVRRLSTL